MKGMNQQDWKDSIIEICFLFLRKIFGWIVRLIWIEKVTGLNHIPQNGAAVVAFNHQSYFDFFCFLAVSPRNVHFLAAEKFFEHWLWRHLMTITGQIHVRRTEQDKSHVHNKVFEHLQKGRIIGIFPEGTRAHEREHMQKAFSGVAKYAIKGKVPVVPIGITGTYDILSRHNRKIRFRKIVGIHIGVPLRFERYRDHKLNTRAYHILTEEIMLVISKLSGKTYLHVPTWKLKMN